jgi:hypothetical protein
MAPHYGEFGGSVMEGHDRTQRGRTVQRWNPPLAGAAQRYHEEAKATIQMESPEQTPQHSALPLAMAPQNGEFGGSVMENRDQTKLKQVW